MIDSPFVFGKIAVGKTFTDREFEQKRLTANIRSRINTILISPRRWGKSSLVQQVGQSLQKTDKNFRFCYLDLFNVRTESEFYSLLIREVLRVSFSKWEERVESAKRFFKAITPRFTLGTDPSTDFSVTLDWEEVQKSPEEILNLPEEVSKERKIRVVICLDEFQNVGYFDQPLPFQKKLRAQWQHHTHATYCLYGSKRHIMTELFEDKSMPFYKFGDVFFLEKIPGEYWVPYISGGFKKTGKSISNELSARIAADMENHPYFVQQLAHTLWTATESVCNEATYERTLSNLLSQQSILFQKEIDGLTNPQINFLKALSDNVEQLSAAETLRNYGLGTSGNVNRIKDSLVNKEVLDIAGSGIEFIDPMFRLWFSRVYRKL